MQSSNNSAVTASSTHKGEGKYRIYIFQEDLGVGGRIILE
jgi:hypothetical protein